MKRGSMQSKIPAIIREQLSEDPFMKRCVFENPFCGGRIEWHHAFTYAGKRKNEPWSIIPLCAHHHKYESACRTLISAEVIKRIKHFHAEADFATKYPKSTLLPITVVVKKVGRPKKVVVV